MCKKTIRCLLTVVMCVFSFSVYAQSACDKLFASGVKLQQTMTVASQKNAIAYFEKAKACYDSQAKKTLCDQQIKACRNIMTQITRGNNPGTTPPKGTDGKENSKQPEGTVNTGVEKKQNVTLSTDCAYLKFKGKGGEFKKVKVSCNYPDWKVTETPSWVSYSRNEDNEVVIEVEKNPSKEERSGSFKIECGDKSASLTIIQEKVKKFVIM